MYPVLRFYSRLAKARRQPPIGLFEDHVSHHRCWPGDIDPWMELNNGRTLTLYDMGRIPMAQRNGLARVVRANGWGMAVAGVSVRYRRRVRLFQRFSMVSRLIGWDDRFLYIEQSIWKGTECASHMLLRCAVTGPGDSGIVPAAKVAAALRLPLDSPPLPQWVGAWIAADAMRPWPPLRAMGHAEGTPSTVSTGQPPEPRS